MSDDELRATAEARLGRVLKGKYRIDGVLGIGGMATVFVPPSVRKPRTRRGVSPSMRFSRALGVAVATLALLRASTAMADAAADVRDIRAGKLPVRHEWLGWDASGHARLGTLVCSEGGTVSCRAEFVDLAPEGDAKVTKVLDVVEVYCGKIGSCEALGKKTVAAFVAADEKAMLAVPAVTQTAAAADPGAVFGTVAGEPTRVEVAAFDVGTPARSPNVVTRLVVRGKGGAFEVLGTIDSQAYSLVRSSLDAAYLSPDGKSATFVASVGVTMMCWDFQNLGALAVSLSRHRASLANTIGFRAWKKGDMRSALAAFTEATQDDPEFALGWYNRAAVESRTGDTGAAGASFRKAVALDAGMAGRACKDHDFDALRASAPGLFSCP